MELGAIAASQGIDLGGIELGVVRPTKANIKWANDFAKKWLIAHGIDLPTAKNYKGRKRLYHTAGDKKKANAMDVRRWRDRQLAAEGKPPAKNTQRGLTKVDRLKKARAKALEKFDREIAAAKREGRRRIGTKTRKTRSDKGKKRGPRVRHRIVEMPAASTHLGCAEPDCTNTALKGGHFCISHHDRVIARTLSSAEDRERRGDF